MIFFFWSLTNFWGKKITALGIAFPIRKSLIQTWYSLQYLSIIEGWNDGMSSVIPEAVKSDMFCFFMMISGRCLLSFFPIISTEWSNLFCCWSSWTGDSCKPSPYLPHNVFIPYNDCEVRVGQKITRKQKVHVVASRETGKGNLAYYRSEAWGSNTGIWTQDPCQLNSEFWFFPLKLHKHRHIQGVCLCDDLSWLQCGNQTALSLLLLKRTGCGEEIWWKHSCTEIRTGRSLTTQCHRQNRSDLRTILMLIIANY